MNSTRSPYTEAFADFKGHVWLNTAHQGPLPLAAAAAARDAIADKITPFRIAESSFQLVPQRLREAIGRLIGASPDDVILGNSASYGLDLLANSIKWHPGDEVVVVEGDFPATILPWLWRRDQGVVVRFIRPGIAGVSADELPKHLNRSTRIFCVSWVNSFTGAAIDLDALGHVCRNADVRFIVNVSQALGARMLDVACAPADAITCCGHKWLCGPYGTGFCWIRPSFRASLRSPHAYWWAMQAGRGLESMRDYALGDDLGARAFDVFGTGNFLNFTAWTAAIEFLLAMNPADVAAYDQVLVERLLDRLDPDRWTVLSPRQAPARSTLVIVESRLQSDVGAVQVTLTANGVHVAVREGRLRLAPHVHNSPADLDRAVDILNRVV